MRYLPVVVAVPGRFGTPAVAVFTAALLRDFFWWIFAVGAVAMAAITAALSAVMVARARDGSLPAGAVVVSDPAMRAVIGWGSLGWSALAAVLLVPDATVPWGGALASTLAGLWAAGVAVGPRVVRMEQRDGLRLVYPLNARTLVWPQMLRVRSGC